MNKLDIYNNVSMSIRMKIKMSKFDNHEKDVEIKYS